MTTTAKQDATYAHLSPTAPLHTIGKRRHASLISEEEVHLHLELLKKFADLKRRVEAGEYGKEPQKEQNGDHLPAYTAAAKSEESDQGRSSSAGPSHAWDAFLYRALYRFEWWIDYILPQLPSTSTTTADSAENAPLEGLSALYARSFRPWSLSIPDTHQSHVQDCPEECIPPLDVALIWHAYLLNPSRYVEDGILRGNHAKLVRIKFPMRQLVEAGSDSDKSTLKATSSITRDAEVTWERKNPHFPYDPLAHDPLGETEKLPIACIGCTANCEVSWRDLATPGWSFECWNCQQSLDAQRLIGGWFCRDLDDWSKGGDDQTVSAPQQVYRCDEI